MAIEIGLHVDIHITYVDKEGPLIKIYAQSDKKIALEVERLILQLSEVLKSPDHRPKTMDDLAVGLICCAKFEDDFYYRAKILNLDHLHKVTVLFIDHGNVAQVNVADIRLISRLQAMSPSHPRISSLIEIKELAGEYYLAGVAPKDNNQWDDKTIQSLRRTFSNTDHICNIYEFEGRKILKFRPSRPDSNPAQLLINWMKGVPLTFRDYIKKMMNARRPSGGEGRVPLPQQINMSLPSSNVAPVVKPIPQSRLPLSQPPSIRMPVSNRPSVPGMQIRRPEASISIKSDQNLQFSPELLAPGVSHLVFVSYAEDGPHCFAVQLQNVVEEVLSPMMLDLNNINPQPITAPLNTGSICVGRSSRDNRLCRAIVMNVMNDKVKLYFADFGSAEDVPLSEVYQIPPQFVTPKVMCHKFSLANINDVAYTENEKKLFKSLVANSRTLMITVTPQEANPLKQYCELFLNCKNIKTILAELSQAQQHYLRFAPVSAPLRGSQEKVCVSYVVNPSRLFVQLDKDDYSLKQLMKRVADHCLEAPHIHLANIRPEEPCCALFDDGLWYRAEIIKLVPENKALINFVDFGNTEEIKLTNLRQISPDLVNSLEAQAIPCCLQGYESRLKVDDEISDRLEELILDQKLMMRVLDSMELQGQLYMLIVQLIDNKGRDISSQLEVAKQAPTPVYKNYQTTAKNKYISPTSAAPSASNVDVGQGTTQSNSCGQYDSRGPRNGIPTTIIWRGREVGESGPRFNKEDGRRGEDKPWNRGDREDRGGWKSNTEDGGGYRRGRFDGERKGGFNRDAGDRSSYRKPWVKGGGDGFPKSAPKSLKLGSVVLTTLNYPTGTTLKAQMAWYLSPSQFFVQPMDSNPEFRAMMQAMQAIVRTGTIKWSDDLNVGDYVIARFREDKVLYRACVQEAGVVLKVQYVDYGNIDAVDSGQVWAMEPEFATLPIQAISCCLAGVQPTGDAWPKPASTNLDSHFKADVLDCSVLKELQAEPSNPRYLVKIVKQGEDVAQKIIEAGFAVAGSDAIGVPNELDTSLIVGQTLPVTLIRIQEDYTFFVQSVTKDVELQSLEAEAGQGIKCVLSNAKQGEAFTQLPANTYVILLVDAVQSKGLQVTLFDGEGKMLTLHKNEVEKVEKVCPMPVVNMHQKVCIAHASDDGIFLHKVTFADLLADLPQKLYEFYNESERVEQEWNHGDLCCAKSVNDGQWYRARIKKLGDKIKVQHIDYGNCESIPVSNLRQLDVSFYAPHALALPVTLHVSWSVPVNNLMELAGRIEYNAIVLRNKDGWVVELVDSYGQSLTEKLVELGFAVALENSPFKRDVEGGRGAEGSDVPNEEQLKSFCDEVVAETTKIECASADLTGNEKHVYVSHVNDPNDFYVQVEGTEAELDAIREELTDVSSFESLEEITDDHNGKLIGALFAYDELWYRAQVINITEDGAEVLFVDYGNTAIATQFVKLPEPLEMKSPMALHCALRKENWPEEVSDHFFDLCDDGNIPFRMTILEDSKLKIVSLANEEMVVEKELLGFARSTGLISVATDNTLEYMQQITEDLITKATNFNVAETSSTVLEPEVNTAISEIIEEINDQPVNSTSTSNGIGYDKEKKTDKLKEEMKLTKESNSNTDPRNETKPTTKHDSSKTKGDTSLQTPRRYNVDDHIVPGCISSVNKKKCRNYLKT